MPNWCENTLTVEVNEPGDDVGIEDLDQFIEKASGKEGTQFSLDEFLPCPTEKWENGEWYNWCITNWGTKWDVETFFVDESDDESVIYHFDSAWSPPIEGITSISEQYPNLRFSLEYDEPGMDFAGSIVLRAGEVLSEDFYPSPTNILIMEEEDFLDEEPALPSSGSMKKCKRTT